jgi:polar amino acid transport system substrate-binding protein
MLGRCVSCWAVALLSFLAVSGPALADDIRIRADPWLPYSGGGEMKPAGYMVEMAKVIAEANGHTIDYRTMPWTNALDVVREGKADCVVGAYKSDAEGFAFPAVGWGPSGNVFWGLAEQKWRFNGIASLDEVKVGVLEDYSYGDELDGYIEQHAADAARLEVVPAIGRGIVRLLARLIGKRVDAIIEDRNVLAYALEQSKMDPDRVISLGEAGEPESVYIACTPADPRGQRYADMFGNGTAQLRASGKLAEILARYNLKDWEGVEK